jgi:hypothetical protein
MLAEGLGLSGIVSILFTGIVSFSFENPALYFFCTLELNLVTEFLHGLRHAKS